MGRTMDRHSCRVFGQNMGSPGEANDPISRLNPKFQCTDSKNPSYSPKAKSRQPQELAVVPTLRILTQNVEGLSAAKRSPVEVIAYQHSIDVICLQDTHVDADVAGCYTINGHAKHSLATYVQFNIDEANHLATTQYSDAFGVQASEHQLGQTGSTHPARRWILSS